MVDTRDAAIATEIHALHEGLGILLLYEYYDSPVPREKRNSFHLLVVADVMMHCRNIQASPITRIAPYECALRFAKKFALIPNTHSIHPFFDALVDMELEELLFYKTTLLCERYKELCNDTLTAQKGAQPIGGEDKHAIDAYKKYILFSNPKLPQGQREMGAIPDESKYTGEESFCTAEARAALGMETMDVLFPWINERCVGDIDINTRNGCRNMSAESYLDTLTFACRELIDMFNSLSTYVDDNAILRDAYTSMKYYILDVMYRARQYTSPHAQRMFRRLDSDEFMYFLQMPVSDVSIASIFPRHNEDIAAI
jgi:hypothetical protein